MATHFEFLVEEPSMEAFLSVLLPRILAAQATFDIHTYQGKSDLLKKLDGRLRGYARWLPQDHRIVVLVDRDDDDCASLKTSLDDISTKAGLNTKASANPVWQVVNRIAIEELEAWFFGEWKAVRAAYPKLNANTVSKQAYRDCDKIAGGTWEALERVMKPHGYFTGGLRKVELATAVGAQFNPAECVSPSFRKLHDALAEAISPLGGHANVG
ncbi:DUF4276 family protein [Rhizobium sp. SSA_523]|uniref:DUF4276 family protein n=1 Tax=Rhizobium sp. SSA_523 TaxID=2952477 RepID=UPI0020908596|nr:DUF4276 family protein [Rhizobium sp. SSA_523]MCO5730457.1 DUF4276 family protein [Rhizobium sp. SSA_523]WKC25499.1 DUF4276 family protein [Rhizobium sp. SSA_523]